MENEDTRKCANLLEKMIAIFEYYNKLRKLHILMPALSETTVNELYKQFKDDMNEDGQRQMFNNMKINQLMEFLK